MNAEKKKSMTFDGWWEEHWFEISPQGGPAGSSGMEEVWNAAQEAVLIPLLGGEDE